MGGCGYQALAKPYDVWSSAHRQKWKAEFEIEMNKAVSPAVECLALPRGLGSFCDM